MIKKILFTAIVSTVLCNSFAQNQHYVTLDPMKATTEFAISGVTGVPFKEESLASGASGSRYLFDDWKPGIVILYNGTAFSNVMLKFDAVKSKFYFNRHDTLFELMDDATEVQLNNTKNDEIMDFKKIISGDDKNSDSTFVRVLNGGKVPLYKEYSKKIEGENMTNGIFTSEKRLVPHNGYWSIINNETISVKLNKQSLEKLTSDKIDMVQEFVKTKKLNVKNEKDFTEIINYYNQISVVK
jgi:hypothetical protein